MRQISVPMQLSAVEDIRRSLSSKTAGSTSGPSTRESRMGDIQDRRRHKAFASPRISAPGAPELILIQIKFKPWALSAKMAKYDLNYITPLH